MEGRTVCPLQWECKNVCVAKCCKAPCTGLGALVGRNSSRGFFSGGNDCTSSRWFCGRVVTLLGFGLYGSTWIQIKLPQEPCWQDENPVGATVG